jgi:ABC-type sugar transport system ATPase subunit
VDRLLEIVRSLKAEGVAVIYVSHKLEEVFVVGYNGDTIALEAMKAGDMAGAVQQVPYEMCKMTVGIGHVSQKIEKLAAILGVEVIRVC